MTGAEHGPKNRSLIYPLATVAIRGVAFAAPHDAVGWLRSEYGEHWMVPDADRRLFSPLHYELMGPSRLGDPVLSTSEPARAVSEAANDTIVMSR